MLDNYHYYYYIVPTSDTIGATVCAFNVRRAPRTTVRQKDIHLLRVSARWCLPPPSSSSSSSSSFKNERARPRRRRAWVHNIRLHCCFVLSLILFYLKTVVIMIIMPTMHNASLYYRSKRHRLYVLWVGVVLWCYSCRRLLKIIVIIIIIIISTIVRVGTMYFSLFKDSNNSYACNVFVSWYCSKWHRL